LQRGWCSQTIPRTERTSVARNRILFSDDTVLSLATGTASSNLRCSSHRLQTRAGDSDPGNAHRPDTPVGRSPLRRPPAQAGNAFPPPARRAVTLTHILPCTIPLSPPPLTSGRAEPVRCQRRARTPQAHCTTRRDHRDAQARTLLFGRAEPIATRPLSGKPPTKSRRCRPRRALPPQRAMSDPPVPLSRPARGTARGRAARQGMFRSVRRAPHRSVDQRAPSPSPTSQARTLVAMRDRRWRPPVSRSRSRPVRNPRPTPTALGNVRAGGVPRTRPLVATPASTSASRASDRRASAVVHLPCLQPPRDAASRSRHRARRTGSEQPAPGVAPRRSDRTDVVLGPRKHPRQCRSRPAGVGLLRPPVRRAHGRGRHSHCADRRAADRPVRRPALPALRLHVTGHLRLGSSPVRRPARRARLHRQPARPNAHPGRDRPLRPPDRTCLSPFPWRNDRRPRAVRIGSRPQAPPLDRFLVRFLLTVHHTADTPSTPLAPTDAPLAPAPGHPAEHRPSPSANQRRVAARLSPPRPLFRPCRSGQPAALDRPVPG
jgi:hypothetical protein